MLCEEKPGYREFFLHPVMREAVKKADATFTIFEIRMDISFRDTNEI